MACAGTSSGIMTEHTSGERGAQESGKVKWGSCSLIFHCGTETVHSTAEVMGLGLYASSNTCTLKLTHARARLPTHAGTHACPSC